MIAHPSFFSSVPYGATSAASHDQLLLPWADPYIARLHAEHALMTALESGHGMEDDSEVLLADESFPRAWLEAIATN